MPNRHDDNGMHFIWGGTLPVILKAFAQNHVSLKYMPTIAKGLIASSIYMPFRWYERLKYKKMVNDFRIEQPPIFIIGHWRSGTTHLHNLMSSDPQTAYLSTLQALFPEMLLDEKLRNKVRNMIDDSIPEDGKRIQDDVKLGVDEPQEEEFTLGNMNTHSYYFSAYFPNKTKKYYKKYILFKGVGKKIKKRWKDDYTRLIKKAILIKGGTRYLSKNPPNMGRIPMLLEMFPNAKFVYIRRNPIAVFLSMEKLRLTLMDALKLQDISEKKQIKNTFYVYKKIVKQYENDKALIPAGNLVEVSFEDIEKNPLQELQRIYETLSLAGFDMAEPFFEQKIASLADYKKNKYRISQKQLDAILAEWQFAMEKYGYDVPENVEII